MGPSNYHKEYQKNEVSTSNQGKLIIMMYDGAIKYANMAIQALDKKDMANKGLYIQKTHDIVNELSLALDLDKGGEVSRKLEDLYQFVLRQLTLANMKGDRQALESILKILNPLREAWEQIFNGPLNPELVPNTSPSKTITNKC